MVDGDTVYVDTFNPVERAADSYDAIYAYSLSTGAPLTDRPNPIKVPRMMSPAIMGLAAMAQDSRGRLYVADMNGRVLRIDPFTGSQSDYGRFPTSSMTSLTAMPDGIAFDNDGNLYATDGSAPIIWRIPPGGGEAKVWFSDPRVAGAWASGMDGDAVDPTGTFLYFGEGYGSASAIYRLPLSHPDGADLQLVHFYPPPPPTPDPGDSEIYGVFGVTAIAFGSSGDLYVVLMGANQVSILRPDGTEKLRFPTVGANAADGHLYQDPIFPAFDGTGHLLITNMAIRTPAKSYVLNAWVDDKGSRIVRPRVP